MFTSVGGYKPYAAGKPCTQLKLPFVARTLHSICSLKAICSSTVDSNCCAVLPHSTKPIQYTLKAQRTLNCAPALHVSLILTQMLAVNLAVKNSGLLKQTSC